MQNYELIGLIMERYNIPFEFAESILLNVARDCDFEDFLASLGIGLN